MSASTRAETSRPLSAAWERVDPRSSWATRAGLARARTLVGDLGRFSDGETILVGLLGDSGP